MIKMIYNCSISHAAISKVPLRIFLWVKAVLTVVASF